MALKDSSEGDSSEWAGVAVTHLFIHLVGKKWPEVTIYADSWAGAHEGVRCKEWNKEVGEHNGSGNEA